MRLIGTFAKLEFRHTFKLSPFLCGPRKPTTGAVLTASYQDSHFWRHALAGGDDGALQNGAIYILLLRKGRRTGPHSN
jgi:hypothetical protein